MISGGSFTEYLNKFLKLAIILSCLFSMPFFASAESSKGELNDAIQKILPSYDGFANKLNWPSFQYLIDRPELLKKVSLEFDKVDRLFSKAPVLGVVYDGLQLAAEVAQVQQAKQSGIYSDEQINRLIQERNDRFESLGIGITLSLVAGLGGPVAKALSNSFQIGDFIITFSEQYGQDEIERSVKAVREALASNRERRNIVLIIDSSGSMQNSDPENLRWKALELVAAMSDFFNYVGVIEFDDAAKTLVPMTFMGSIVSPTRSMLRLSKNRVDSEGGTNIPAGLKAAVNMVGAAPGQVEFVLLTDGQDQSGWSGQTGSLPQGIKVHTIALSGDADRLSMRALSDATGGIAEIASSNQDLKRIFSNLFGVAQGSESLLLSENMIMPGQIQPYYFYVEPGTQSLQYSVDWPGSDIDLIVTEPGGKKYDTTASVKEGFGIEGTTYDLIKIAYPQAGQWKVEVKAVDVSSVGERYSVRATSKGSPLAVHWSLDMLTPAIDQDFTIRFKATEKIKWDKASVSIWETNGKLSVKVPLRIDRSGVLSVPAPQEVGAHRLLVEAIGHDTAGKTVNRSFDRTVEFIKKTKLTTQSSAPKKSPKQVVKSKPATNAEPKVMDLNSIIRSLAPIAGQVDASKRSIDLDIPFQFNSSQLSPSAEQQLQELGKALHSQKLKHLKIKIIGHTDAAGDANYNKNLSKKRAASVAKYLRERFKIDAERLETSGRGEAQLKDKLNPESSINRRVEVIAEEMKVPANKKLRHQPEKRDDGIRWSSDSLPVQGSSANKKENMKIQW